GLVVLRRTVESLEDDAAGLVHVRGQRDHERVRAVGGHALPRRVEVTGPDPGTAPGHVPTDDERARVLRRRLWSTGQVDRARVITAQQHLGRALEGTIQREEVLKR